MRVIFKIFLKYYLKFLAKLALVLYQPFIVAITGSTNKTFFKEEVVRILQAKNLPVLSNAKSFNTEIGLPLAILSLPSGYNSFSDWLKIIFQAPLAVFKRLPKYLVLELGISNPGDMKYLLSIIQPRIAIITDITQRYVESFSDIDGLIGEYEYLAQQMKNHDLLVLNNDNQRIKQMARITQARVATFGLNEGADWQAVEVKKDNAGQIVNYSHEDIVNIEKIKYFGEHHVYALLAGLIVKNEL